MFATMCGAVTFSEVTAMQAAPAAAGEAPYLLLPVLGEFFGDFVFALLDRGELVVGADVQRDRAHGVRGVAFFEDAERVFELRDRLPADAERVVQRQAVDVVVRARVVVAEPLRVVAGRFGRDLPAERRVFADQAVRGLARAGVVDERQTAAGLPRAREILGEVVREPFFEVRGRLVRLVFVEHLLGVAEADRIAERQVGADGAVVAGVRAAGARTAAAVAAAGARAAVAAAGARAAVAAAGARAGAAAVAAAGP